MAVNIEVLLKRQKEVFETFINNHGREDSLLPLVKKYIEEDKINGEDQKEVISIVHLLSYIKLYVKSSNITDNEKEAYIRVTTMTDEKKAARGAEIVSLLVENRGKGSEVKILAKKFAQEDGKIKTYSSDEMKELLNFYIANNRNAQLVKKYRAIIEMLRTKSKTGTDLVIIDKLLECKDKDEAIQTINAIGVSQQVLETLLKTYTVLYPNKPEAHDFIEDCIKEAYKKTTQPSNSYNTQKKAETLLKFRSLLHDYTTGDLTQIDKLFATYEFTKPKFERLLKEQRISGDEIMLLEIDKYDLKEAVLNEKRKQELEAILSGIINGVYYGTKQLKFNTYDLRRLTEMNDNEICFYASKLLSRGGAETIKKFINKTSARVYKTAEELFQAINYGIGGRMATPEEKWLVIKHMELNGWPYSALLFADSLMRFMNNDLILTEKQLEQIQEDIELKEIELDEIKETKMHK